MSKSEKQDRIIELFILDVYVAILKIKRVTSEFDEPQALLHDFRSWDSIIREFEIIGEASKHLIREKLVPQNYQMIVDFRNKITHEYFGIDQDIVWAITHHDLESIENVIINLIENIDIPLRKELIESFIEDNIYLDFIVEKLKQFNIGKIT